MLEYIIELLKKVSFDKILFMKEFNKARRWLTQEEMISLMKWARENHPDKLEFLERQLEKHQERKYSPRIN